MFVDVQLLFNETGRLIECAEKKGKKSVEETKSVSIVDVPGRGKKNGKPSDKSRGYKSTLSTCR